MHEEYGFCSRDHVTRQIVQDSSCEWRRVRRDGLATRTATRPAHERRTNAFLRVYSASYASSVVPGDVFSGVVAYDRSTSFWTPSIGWNLFCCWPQGHRPRLWAAEDVIRLLN